MNYIERKINHFYTNFTSSHPNKIVENCNKPTKFLLYPRIFIIVSSDYKDR